MKRSAKRSPGEGDLNAVGGDCLEDFDSLREDAGLAEMLGHEVPSADAGRKFLYQFHDAATLVHPARKTRAAGSDWAAVFQLATRLALVAFTRAPLKRQRSSAKKDALRPQQKGRSVCALRLPDQPGPPPLFCGLPRRVISPSPHRSQSPLTAYGRITAAR
jgi:hypothetical protein